MKANYDIKRDENGKQLCRFVFEWVNKHGQSEKIETDNILSAQTIIGLLSGEITLSDLEP